MVSYFLKTSMSSNHYRHQLVYVYLAPIFYSLVFSHYPSVTILLKNFPIIRLSSCFQTITSTQCFFYTT
uniref:Uncharacterized protein n=1 Tax=Myoviridae sp. ctqfO1 TaxID=2827710 RepID=A0A8S5T3C5_9CAUD|nr:MAG TPA: hypothetical protein [Myoviridae sp. ctqfO1]